MKYDIDTITAEELAALISQQIEVARFHFDPEHMAINETDKGFVLACRLVLQELRPA